MVVFEKPKSLTDVPLHYCPGCTHGIVHRLVAEAIDELGIEGKTVGIAPVGCSVMAYDYFTCDMIEAAHGHGRRYGNASVLQYIQRMVRSTDFQENPYGMAVKSG